MCLQEKQLQLARDLRAKEPEEIQTQLLAYRLWEERGRPVGNPEEDWSLAEKLLSLAKAEEEVRKTLQAPEPEPQKFSLSQEIFTRYHQVRSQERVAQALGVTRWYVRKVLGKTGREQTCHPISP
jgi:hypothetical protein